MKNAEYYVSLAISSEGKTLADLNTGYRCEWCAKFIDWLFYNDEMPAFSGDEHTSCTSQMNYWKRNNQWHEKTDIENVTLGAILYYDWDLSGDCDHVGIVTKVTDDSIYVTEGNNGNTGLSWDTTSVATRRIPYNYRYIRGYATPPYSNGTTTPPTTTTTTAPYRTNTLWTTRMVSTYSPRVELLQTMLNTVVSTANLVVDGYYGDLTAQAVAKFQRTVNLTPDGITGINTIKELSAQYMLKYFS